MEWKRKRIDYQGKLRFEGNYLYGEKLNGREYINKKIEYEGQYLFGKKWNGKGYDAFGNVIYELVNGSGKVKEYNLDGKIIFEGEYLEGKRKGTKKEYKKSKLILEGEYLNGEKMEKERNIMKMVI